MADGAQVVGVVVALSCFSFRCRWPVVDGSRCNGPMRASAPTGMPKAIAPVVGADALIRPPVQAPTTAWGARSEAERAEGGTSGTLVTEILGAPQRETVKEELVKCVLAPR